MGLEVCIPTQLPCDAKAAGPWTTEWPDSRNLDTAPLILHSPDEGWSAHAYRGTEHGKTGK